MKVLFGAVVTTAALLLSARGAAAQDTRWTPWLGCWDLVNENVREGVGAARASALSPEPSAGAVTELAPRVCVVRAGGNGVTITTTVPGQKPVEQTLVPDGIGRPIADAECRGTEHTEWSRNGQRLFARAEVTCGDATPRSISGLGLITADNTWLDIRSFRVGAGEITRVSRYRRVPSDDTALVPTVGAPLTMNEVKEAITKVTEPVLEAALAETGPRFEVNKRTLLELADAGAPPSVIDVIVALAYPERFVIERGDTQVSASAEGPIAHPYPFGIDDYYYSGFYYPSYYYSPFAFGYIGRYDPYIFVPIYGGSVPIGGNGSVRPSGTGRVINGEGYTRIRPTSVEEAASSSRPASGGTSSSAASRDSSSGRSTSGGSGSRTASPRGYSSGDGGFVVNSSGGGASSSSSGGGGASSGSSGGGGGGSSSSSSAGSSGGSSSSGSSGSSGGGGSSGGDGGGGRTAQPR